MTLTIISRSNRIDQDVTDVRVKTDDWEGTLAISGLEEMEAGSLEAAVDAKMARRDTQSAKHLIKVWGNPHPLAPTAYKRIDKIAKY